MTSDPLTPLIVISWIIRCGAQLRKTPNHIVYKANLINKIKEAFEPLPKDMKAACARFHSHIEAVVDAEGLLIIITCMPLFYFSKIDFWLRYSLSFPF